eukprot:TRINITY_DN7807_c0_g1_i1.p1 TRINITY_DN7807_c0_g1~~TRINITY_DN7807_c0_g1_i1.p1  ORF type:complete len:161 (+),score=7.99 TRINITY_DN7807_c0_g1_i1:45-485(+)
MKSILFLVLVFALFSFSSSLYKWENCEPNNFNVLNLTMSPNPPVAGKTVTFSAYGTLGDLDITAGTWYAEAYLSGVLVQSFSGPVCSIVAGSCACPCQGPKNTTAVLTFPVSIATPPGSTVTTNMTAVDQLGNQFVCVNSTFTIAK